MNDEIIEEMLKKIWEDGLELDLNTMFSVCFVCSCKHDGKLRDCLKKITDDQLKLIASLHEIDFEQLKIKKKSEKITALEKNIFQFLETNLFDLPPGPLRDLKGIVDDPNYVIQSKIWLGLGVVYFSIVDGQEMYYLPTDIKAVLQNKMTDQFFLDAIRNNIIQFLLACHYVYGLVSKDVFVKVYKERYPDVCIDDFSLEIQQHFEQIIIEDQIYYWPKAYPVIEKARDFIHKPADISFDDIFLYFTKFIQLFPLLEEVLKKPTEEWLRAFLANFIASPIEIDKAIDSFCLENAFSLRQANNLRKIFDDIQELRYWSLGGKTIDEEQLPLFVLSKKPTNNTLKACLNTLGNRAKEVLYQKYAVKKTEELEHAIIKHFLDQQDEFSVYFFEAQGKEYTSDIVDASDVVWGHVFLYTTDDGIKVMIPEEIEALKELPDDDEYDTVRTDLIRAYLLLNGVIDKKVLQDLLKRHHGLEYSIKELDEMILDDGYFIIGNKYSMMQELSDFEFKMIYDPKKGREYKIVDENIDSVLDILEDFYDDLENLLRNLSVSDISKQEFFGTVSMLLHLGIYRDDTMKELMEQNHFKLDKTTLRAVLKCINKYKNIFPLWPYNGFTKAEISIQPKKVKVGRNDLCPCGSGKKYKKCCGK